MRGQHALNCLLLPLISVHMCRPTQNGLEVRFLAMGGHPVLLAQRGGYPTLLHNDFLFR